MVLFNNYGKNQPFCLSLLSIPDFISQKCQENSHSIVYFDFAFGYNNAVIEKKEVYDLTAPQAITQRKNIIRSFAWAFRGIYFAFKSERNFKIHTVILCFVIALGIYLKLSILDWGLVIFSIGFVLVSELFNTAIEELGDEVAENRLNSKIKKVKDISAGAVLLSSITALIIGIIILLVPFISKIIKLW
jgi:diacylglycerol kinase